MKMKMKMKMRKSLLPQLNKKLKNNFWLFCKTRLNTYSNEKTEPIYQNSYNCFSPKKMSKKYGQNFLSTKKDVCEAFTTFSKNPT